MTLFDNFFEEQAIERIKKFSRIATKLGFKPAVGFSGGKDSVVLYHLCKRAQIDFDAFFNHCFESATTLKFIRENFPDVKWRRFVPEGFFVNIKKNHAGMLPTVKAAYCCDDYKHNSKKIDAAVITGVRAEESISRRQRRVFGIKNKTIKKKNLFFSNYFTENCTELGESSVIALRPLLDWSSENIWNYIKKYNLPVNPTYKECSRVGCVICPKANFNGNYKALLKMPKLIDAAIKACEGHVDFKINSIDLDLSDNKPLYVCYWLNYSFRQFSAKQKKLVDMVLDNYKKSNSQNNI